MIQNLRRKTLKRQFKKELNKRNVNSLKSKIKNVILLSIALSAIIFSSVGAPLNVGSYADAKINYKKIIGSNRYKTAVEFSKYAYPNGVSEAIVVGGFSAADALSVAPLSKVKSCPVLLTPSNRLNKDTQSELKRLGVKQVTIVGGRSSVGIDVGTQLESSGYKVRRISGKNKSETSLEVARELKTITKVDKFKGVFLVDGDRGIADAACAGAAAAKYDSPMIFMGKDKSQFKDEINLLGFDEAYMIGASAAKQGYLFNSYESVFGKNRKETSLKIAEKFFGYNVGQVFLVKGGSSSMSELIDAVTIGGYAGKTSSPVIYVEKKDRTIDTRRNYILKSVKNSVIQVGGGNESTIDSILNHGSDNLIVLKNNVDKANENNNVDLRELPPNSAKNDNVTTTNAINDNRYVVDPSLVMGNGIARGYIILGAPHYNQYDAGAPMGCEAASLLQGLHYKGYAKDKTLYQFLREMPIANDDNPNHGFAATPFRVVRGVYQSILPAPMAKWGQKYGNVVDFSGARMNDIKREITKGNPVVFFGTGNFKNPIYRDYFWGKNAVDNAHVMLVDGYDEDRMHIVDPADDRSSYWIDNATFKRIYDLKRYAVVIR